MRTGTPALLVALLGRSLAGQDAAPPAHLWAAIVTSTIDPSLRPLPLERWETARLPPLPAYPAPALLAGVEGELLMHGEIDAAGRVVKTRLVAGPPQLAATLDRWLRAVQFRILPEDGPGPWHYAVSARFALPGRIQIFPSASKLIPHAPELGPE